LDVGTPTLFNTEAKSGRPGPDSQEPLNRRVAAGTGGFNLIASYDSRQRKVIVMSVGDDLRPDVWTYDPSTDSWRQLPSPSSAPKLVGVFEPGLRFDEGRGGSTAAPLLLDRPPR
jgi:hypothetical protein